jgi:hypothetical protein
MGFATETVPDTEYVPRPEGVLFDESTQAAPVSSIHDPEQWAQGTGFGEQGGLVQPGFCGNAGLRSKAKARKQIRLITITPFAFHAR